MFLMLLRFRCSPRYDLQYPRLNSDSRVVYYGRSHKSFEFFIAIRLSLSFFQLYCSVPTGVCVFLSQSLRLLAVCCDWRLLELIQIIFAILNWFALCIFHRHMRSWQCFGSFLLQTSFCWWLLDCWNKMSTMLGGETNASFWPDVSSIGDVYRRWYV